MKPITTLYGQKADVICGLSEDAVSSSEYIPSSTRNVNDWRIGKHVEGISLT